jgi:hypothetical protein
MVQTGQLSTTTIGTRMNADQIRAPGRREPRTAME